MIDGIERLRPGLAESRSDAKPSRWGARRGDPVGIPRSTLVLLVVLVLCLYAVVLVGWEVVQQKIFPEMTTGLSHALLVLRAGVVTAIASLMVFALMRRQQRRLAKTAGVKFVRRRKCTHPRGGD